MYMCPFNAGQNFKKHWVPILEDYRVLSEKKPLQELEFLWFVCTVYSQMAVDLFLLTGLTFVQL